MLNLIQETRANPLNVNYILTKADETSHKTLFCQFSANPLSPKCSVITWQLWGFFLKKQLNPQLKNSYSWSLQNVSPWFFFVITLFHFS